MAERLEFEVKKRTTYGSETWEPGTVIEVSAAEAEEYPLKGMIEAGIVEKVESEEKDASPDADRVTDDLGVEEDPETAGMLSKPDLTDIDGIGPSYAESILEKYGTEESLLEAPDEEIAELHGITPELASKVKDELR